MNPAKAAGSCAETEGVSRRDFLCAVAGCAAAAAGACVEPSHTPFFRDHLHELTDAERRDLIAGIEADLKAKHGVDFTVGDEGPMPGVVAVLETLSAAGTPKAVVSSSSHRWVDGWLEKLGLAGHFQSTVSRGEAARTKPAPDLFLKAAERLDITSTE